MTYIFSDRYLDKTVSEICGRIRVGLDKSVTPIGLYDLQIGARIKTLSVI